MSKLKNKHSEHPNHDEVMSLLPWFVNQTMEESQRQEVYLHIKHCDECQDEIKYLTSLNEVVQQDAEQSYAMQADINKDFASVMNRIDAETQINPIKPKDSGSTLLNQKLSELFGFLRNLSIPQWSVTAMASVLVAILGFQLFYVQPNDNYSVLSSSEMNNTSMMLSVEINPTANKEQIRSKINNELAKTGQQAEIEIKNDGMYIVTFKDSLDVKDLSKLITDLKKQEQINHVEVMP